MRHLGVEVQECNLFDDIPSGAIVLGDGEDMLCVGRVQKIKGRGHSVAA